jgi:hypothetical protein
MKLASYKKWFLKIVLDFLISDYSSWKVLEMLIFERRKPRDRLKPNLDSLLSK